jgi:hypothetical protein
MRSNENIIVIKIVFYLVIASFVAVLILVLYHFINNDILVWLSTTHIFYGGGVVTEGLVVIMTLLFQIAAILKLYHDIKNDAHED